MKQSSLIPVETIERTIYLIRGQRVMLDTDLALLYQVTTKALNQAVRRNRDRFPDDFMFQLTTQEFGELKRSQIVTASQKHRDPRFRPYAFTEQGVAMLSSVLHSKRAIFVNIEIMRTFARLRMMLATNTELSRRLDELESKYDRQFKVVFDAIRQLMSPPAPRAQTDRLPTKTREEVVPRHELQTTHRPLIPGGSAAAHCGKPPAFRRLPSL